MADEKDGASAPAREAKRVEDGAQPKNPDGGDEAALSAKEGVVRVEQDNRVEAVARQAKEAGAGAGDSAKDLNKDG